MNLVFLVNINITQGVICQDLLAINRVLISQHWFTVEEYNESLKTLGYYSYENSDKPMPLAQGPKVQKLKGKAVSLWVHMRNWPFIIRSMVNNADCKVLGLGLLLHEIVERITAPQFRDYEVEILEEKIYSYLDSRAEIREEFPRFISKPKPKHHFM